MTSIGASIMDTVVEFLYPAGGTGGQDGSDRADSKEVGLSSERHESGWQLVDKTENASPVSVHAL